MCGEVDDSITGLQCVETCDLGFLLSSHAFNYFTLFPSFFLLSFVSSCSIQFCSNHIVSWRPLSSHSVIFYNGKIQIRRHTLFSMKMNSDITGFLTHEHSWNLTLIDGRSYVLLIALITSNQVDSTIYCSKELFIFFAS